MNRRLMTIIALALSIATCASYVVYHLIRTKVMANAAPVANRIVIATRSLETGALIHEGDLGFANWVGTVPKGFSISPKELLGRGVVSAIYEGEPITENRLAAPGAGGGL